MSDQFSANLRGAVDLSALRQPSTASVGATAAANPGAATPQSSEPIAVASLISAMTETNLRYFLELSSKVVVLVDFYSTADESSVALSAKLESLIDGFAGKVVLCRVDVAEQPRVAEAFGVTAPATLLAMMAGQPVPLFSGDQQLEKIQ